MTKQKWYWLAVNGSSCAAWEIPCERVGISPKPELVIGVSTRREQLEIQHICLNEPMEKVHRKFQEIAALASVYQAVFFRVLDPEPQTHGPTIWEAHGFIGEPTAQAETN